MGVEVKRPARAHADARTQHIHREGLNGREGSFTTDVKSAFRVGRNVICCILLVETRLHGALI